MMQRSSRRLLVINIASSYANFGLMALITLLVVPVYVHTLGAAQWGLVALCMTLQGVLFSIDVALGPLMLRDIARATQQGRQASVHQRFLRLYVGVALGLFVLAQLAVSALHNPPLATPIDDELALALRIVLVQFLFQFSNNAAIGFWNGQERQGFANQRLAVFLLIKHGLAVLLVTQWSATAIAYLIPFALVCAIEFVVNQLLVRREATVASKALAPSALPMAEVMRDDSLGGQWRDVLGFAWAAGLGVLTTQIDRIYLSLTLPAAQFGVYFVICSLMLSLLHLQVPIHRAFLPRMATAAAPSDVLAAMLRVSVLLLVLPCLLMAVFPQTLLWLWLHDAGIAAAGAESFRLMLIAVALIALFSPFGSLLLSQQRYRLMTAMNAAVVVLQVLLLWVFVPRLGMSAGALAWLGCGAIQVSVAVIIWRSIRRAAPQASRTPR